MIEVYYYTIHFLIIIYQKRNLRWHHACTLIIFLVVIANRLQLNLHHHGFFYL